MVTAGRWLRNFLSRKKEKNQEKKTAADRRILPQLLPPPPPPPPPPPSTPMEEQRRRSFSPETKRHKPPPSSLRRSATRKTGFSALETFAAVKIQASFRSFLARKALRALKGLVKLQAAVRGFLVRKQAAAALRSMQALLTVQGRARALRVRMSQESPTMPMSWKEVGRRRTTTESKLRRSTSINRGFHSKERSFEKLIEMEHAQSKCSSSRGRNTNPTMQQPQTIPKSFSYHKSFSAPSPPTDSNTGARHAQPDELSVPRPARSSSSHASTSTNPHRISVGESGMWRLSHDSSLFPNYMANTEAWKAKARSQSAPRQRSGSPDSKQSAGGQRPSFDGKSLAEAAWAWSRSSSAAREQIPWAVALDRSVTHAGY